MNKFKKIFFSLFVLCLFYPQLGFSSATVEILGTIIRYDETKVTLLKEDKRGKGEVTVPITSIPEHFKIQTGQCIYSVLDYEDFMSRMRRLYTEQEIQDEAIENMNN